MIEEKIDNLTKAILVLADAVVNQNKILFGTAIAAPLLHQQAKDNIAATMQLSAENLHGNLDDRGQPIKSGVLSAPDFEARGEVIGEIAPAKPKRSRAKKETTPKIETLPANDDNAPILGDVGFPPQEEVVEAIPTTQKAALSITDLREAFKNYTDKHKDYTSAVALLNIFGANKLDEVPADKYENLIALSKLGKIEKLDKELISKYK